MFNFISKLDGLLIKQGYCRSIWSNIKLLFNLCCGCCKEFDEDDLNVQRAPEPNEIEWENLKFNKYNKFFAKLSVGLKVSFLMVVSFGIIIELSSIQLQNKTSGNPSTLTSNLLGYLVTIALILLTPIIVVVCVNLSAKEKHDSKTEFATAAANRVVFYKFIKMAFTVILSRLILQVDYSSFSATMNSLQTVDFYSPVGVVRSIMAALVVTIAMSPVSYILNYAYIIRLFKRNTASNNGGINLTQQEAHALFEGPEFFIEYRYGYLLSTTLLISFYAHALPAAIVVALGGLFCNYWAEKWVFLRRIALPRSLGKKLQYDMIEYMEWTILFFSLGSWLFSKTLEDNLGNSVYDNTNGTLIIVAIAISFINMIIPAGIYNKIFSCYGEKQLESMDYDQAKLLFLTDYDIENPATKQESVKRNLYQKEHVKKVKTGGQYMQGMEMINMHMP